MGITKLGAQGSILEAVKQAKAAMAEPLAQTDMRQMTLAILAQVDDKIKGIAEKIDVIDKKINNITAREITKHTLSFYFSIFSIFF
jgi:hypothetical protein